MKKEQAQVFLSKMKEKIYEGEFDDKLNLPFMSRKLFYSSLKDKVNKKLETGTTPLLSENEILDILNDVRETAVITAALFIETGIIKKTEDGYSVNPSLHKGPLKI